MFDPTDKPRVFGLPPGTDFPASLVAGLIERTAAMPPEALARVTILVNTRRMQRRVKALISEGPARLLPRIALVTELDTLLPDADLPPPMSPLRRKLELTTLVAKLIEADPEIAPRSAAVALADSLAALMDEMQGEGVPLQALEGLDTGDLTGHWDRSLRFLAIIRQFTDLSANDWLGPEARRRRAAELLIERWAKAPPNDPIIVAGSTGSRATTAMVMQAVARLPNGAVILPGFDFEMPENLLMGLTQTRANSSPAEDHPQYRFATFLAAQGMSPNDVMAWHDEDARKSRNQLISLSLRPAPFTSQWMAEGPRLGDLSDRVKGLALIEAPDQKSEATAIAIALREAVEQGRTAALITPDRTLGRRVAASLLRWNIVPDDSAGRPLSLSAPGRFLRQVAALIGRPPDPTDLIAVLKHPLAVSGTDDRGPHLRLTRELELFLRRKAIVALSPDAIHAFAQKRADDELNWCNWLADWLASTRAALGTTLADHLSHHIRAAETLAAGGGEGAGELWEQSAGRDVLKLIARFQAERDYRAALPFADYLTLLESALAADSTRDHDDARPDVMIWGTLEARVQGADLVVLGGMNEGTWPEQPTADPWLSRSLRRDLGLLLPERQIGLSAHDYQQAIAANSVILSRSKRDTDSETVPSRWLSRLTNLIEGLRDQNGEAVLADLRARGDIYLSQATILDAPEKNEPSELRPSPAPPATVRPKTYSVTEIQRLIRDPYAIYARHILGLEPLNPLNPSPDARIKGIVFHAIIEQAFALDADFTDLTIAAESLRQIARTHLSRLPWPGIAAHWLGHVDAIADQIVAEEQARRLAARPIALESKGRIDLPGTPFAIKGKADRIDRTPGGSLIVYDYKTGTPPTVEQIRHYDRQLPIEALMAELGGFEDLAAVTATQVGHIGLGRTPKSSIVDLVETDDIDLRTVTIQGELAQLLGSYDDAAKGYVSRRAMEKMRFEGDYDHLARFGEWDETCEPVVVPLP